MRGPRTAMKSGPRLPQLEKSPRTETKTQQSKINKERKKKEKRKSSTAFCCFKLETTQMSISMRTDKQTMLYSYNISWGLGDELGDWD